MNGQPSGSSPTSPHIHSQLSCNSPPQCQHQDRWVACPCLNCLQRTCRIVCFAGTALPCCFTSSLATPSNRLQCASVCKCSFACTCACQVGTVRQKAASVRSCFAYMHSAACTEQLHTSHDTSYSRNRARLQDIISLVDLTCAAPPEQHHKMCTVIPAFITTASKHIKPCMCCNIM